MAEYHVGLLGALIDKLNSLPGIGPRTAQRLAYHLLRTPFHGRFHLNRKKRT